MAWFPLDLAALVQTFLTLMGLLLHAICHVLLDWRAAAHLDGNALSVGHPWKLLDDLQLHEGKLHTPWNYTREERTSNTKTMFEKTAFRI